MRLTLIIVLVLLVRIFVLAQCLENIETIIPEKYPDRFSAFGQSITAYEDYLLIGAIASDTLDKVSGHMQLFKLDLNDKWNKVASLATSSPQKSTHFGAQFTMHNNIIAAVDRNYTTAGNNLCDILIYEKDPIEEWITSTESYSFPLINDPTETTQVFVRDIVMDDEYLIVSYYRLEGSGSNNRTAAINIYSRDISGVFSFEKTIVGPLDLRDNDGFFGYKLGFQDDILVATAPGFGREDFGNGVAFVYQHNGIEWSETAIAKLTYDEPNTVALARFGEEVEILNETIFISSLYTQNTDGTYTPKVYVYNKPITGWEDATEDAQLSILNTTSNAFVSNIAMKVHENYIFLGRTGELCVFEKKGSWQSSTQDYTFEDPQPDSENRPFPNEIAITGNHLVISAIPEYSWTGGEYTSGDIIYDFFQSDGDWTKPAPLNQSMEYVNLNASGARFGVDFSLHGNQLIVGSNQDNELSAHAGAVHAFDRENDDDDWTINEKIFDDIGRKEDYFGYKTLIKDSLMFISSIFSDSLNIDGEIEYRNNGKVKIYQNVNGHWVYHSQVLAPILGTGELQHFGASIAYSDSVLVVGRARLISSGYNGKVFIYKLMNTGKWEYTAELRPSNEPAGDRFGYQIIMNDSMIVVGYETLDNKAYIFIKKGENWLDATEDATLIPSEDILLSSYSRFGAAMDMRGNQIAIGVPSYLEDISETLIGRVYIYEMPRDGWKGEIVESSILEPMDKIAQGHFGFSVSIGSDNIMVGAPHSFDGINRTNYFNNADNKALAGKLYVFPRPNGVNGVINEDYFIQSPNARWLDGFGNKVIQTKDEVYVSSIYGYHSNGYESGSINIFKKKVTLEYTNGSVCTDSEPIILEGAPLGGSWSGEGIVDSNNGIFDPGSVNEGVYRVKYSVIGCELSLIINVREPPQVVDKSESDVSKCMNEEVTLFVETETVNNTYTWFYMSANDNFYSTLPTHSNENEVIASKPGKYYCEIDNGSCSTVREDFLVLDIESTKRLNQIETILLCGNDQFKLELTNSSDIDEHSWFYNSQSEGAYSLLANGISNLDITEPGYYYCQYIFNGCYFNTDTLEVNKQVIDISIKSLESICSRETAVELFANPEGGNWNGEYVINNSHFDATQAPNGDYNISYVYNSPEGCQFQLTIDVNVDILEAPLLNIPSTEICSNHPVDLSFNVFNNHDQIEWLYDDGSNIISIGSSQQVTVDQAGQYWVELNRLDCSSISKSVTITTLLDSLFVPNVITNNNDGFNDDFRFYEQGTSNLALTILNRWGNEIFYDNDDELIWQPDDNQASGVYYWHITYFDCYNQPQSINGWVHLLND